ncbi:MAG: hypothetical protein R3B07_18850 [Polyangiaceae bacterium]
MAVSKSKTAKKKVTLVAKPEAKQTAKTTATAAKTKTVAAKGTAKAAASKKPDAKASKASAKPAQSKTPQPKAPSKTQKSSGMKVSRVGDWEYPTDDPKMVAGADVVEAFKPAGKLTRAPLWDGEGYVAYSEKKSKRRGFYDYTVHWFHDGQLGSTPPVVTSAYLIDVDWTQMRALVSHGDNAEELAELDLNGGTLTPLKLKGIPTTRLRGVGYLDSGWVYVSTPDGLYVCERDGSTLAAKVSHEDLGNTGFGTLEGKLMLGGIRERFLLGFKDGDVRVLWRGEGAASMPRSYADTFRFYDETGCFELTGALGLWDDCFAAGNTAKYPTLQDA